MSELIDLTTLRLSILLTAIICVLALVVVWRINRQLPGILLMTMGVSANLLAFLAGLSASLGLIENWVSVLFTNLFSLTAVTLMADGALRFRGHQIRGRQYVYALLIPAYALITWWNLDYTERRYLFHDVIAVTMLLIAALAMIWKTRNRDELITYGVASAFTLLMAAGFTARWVVTLQSVTGEDVNFANVNLFMYTGVLMYMVGLSFSLVAACYLKSHQSVIQMATEDALTGLPNRRSIDTTLTRQLSQARRQQKPFAVMIMDLDGFKQVNDSFGHLMGDMLLQEVARRLRSFVREADFAARLGGDEFLLLLSGINGPESSSVIVERLRAHMNGDVHINGEQLCIDISQGVAVWPEDGDSMDALMRVADQRMYEEKLGKHI